ncbi:LysM peptidoglycan-binding domain-containing protein [Anaerocolumna sp. AGMB13025]|uniref:LysM peptidoglycan-binding domain-containing protein n=1 Tax=Anaerocolumna sp. AGMB13025 TaxID=3039116 RepID=UPI00241DADA3|nr:LysM peptidoglycan-binding domain-containing protein [Anaerocolumna sp. AGMB13025]WFR58931.1 LysM peptidoglycan-binding domain-containing protein [Anaerocolumna sp. AGMB13025]
MYIHIVQQDDTVNSIADTYGISPERLMIENDLSITEGPVVGEALIILIPSQTYIVQKEDTLESIAKEQGIEVMELLRNNPGVSNRELYMGEELVIRYEDTKGVAGKINGFTYPFIDQETLKKTLPYLTYLTVYSYQLQPNGDLIEIDDLQVVNTAKEYGVAPIMFVNAPHEGEDVDTTIAHSLINNADIRNNFLDNLLRNLRGKGYYGLNFDTPYIQPLDREAYVDFIADLTKRLNSEGFFVMITIAPSTFEVSTGIIYTGVDYIGLSQAANNVLYQLTYAFRYPRNLPISILPFDSVLHTLDNAVTLLSPEKCSLGISIIGYLWEFLYFSAVTYANFINYNSAMDLARNVEAPIQFNDPSRSSYFQFINDDKEYIAWFKDSRVLYPYLSYVNSYGLQGASIWNIMYFTTNIWLLVNSMFIIEKI